MIYYGRTDGNIDKSNWQTVIDHLQSVAKLSADFAKKFKSDDLAYMIGLLHDIGKYSEEFQKRLENKKLRVDHSTAGAKLAYENYKALGLIAAYVIAGHHGGMPDFGTVANCSSLESRLKNSIIPEYFSYKEDIKKLPSLTSFKIPFKRFDGFSRAFYIRMLFSCLVDADSLDAERASGDINSQYRGIEYDMADLESRLAKYIASKTKDASKSKINDYRKLILETCIKKAESAPGLYSLTVPTGGGKTLSSLSFAMHHAVKNNMDRIIYVIPYTSIIEQNADVFRGAVGGQYILEHHSNYQYTEEYAEWSDDIRRISLAAENWDAPIVVTTNVQFFESLFSSKRSRSRKLHNLTNSIIILDEAQMLPAEYLRPCLAAIAELVINYNATVLLCTATQPALNQYIPAGLEPVELMDAPDELYEKFRRVESKLMGYLSDDELVEHLKGNRQALCIVNTRKHAQLLYDKLKGTDGLYHLSARMYPEHRKEKLKEIKTALKEGQACIVISTQLIEAGVDIDFPLVYRALAGIDSIAQAAGRCNREGKLEKGIVNIFIPEKHGMPGGWISRTAEIGNIVLTEFEDGLCMKSVERYFTRLYKIDEELLDRKDILASLELGSKQLQFEFEQISENFKLIDESMISIIIPLDERCNSILKEARWSEKLRGFSRKLQPYTVQVYSYEYNAFLKAGYIEDIAGFKVLTNNELYNNDVGLLQCKGADSFDKILIF